MVPWDLAPSTDSPTEKHLYELGNEAIRKEIADINPAFRERTAGEGLEPNPANNSNYHYNVIPFRCAAGCVGKWLGGQEDQF